MKPPSIPGLKIGKLLGEGATGAVYEAVNDAGDALAVKFLHSSFADDAEVVARFRREARICAKLRSPYIAEVVSAGRDPKANWIAYRRLQGETLSARLRREVALSAAAAEPLLDNVLTGLAVAHAEGVIHRDIKPANIMLESTPSGVRACILDFGVSKDRPAGRTSTGSQNLTSATATLGTIHFMPPEQIGASATVDHRADIYATGVVAYRALTGQLPYIGKSQAHMLDAKLNGDARTLHESTGLQWPAVTEEFFGRALARDRAARFQSAAEMAPAWATACRASGVPSLDAILRRALDTEEADADTALDAPTD